MNILVVSGYGLYFNLSSSFVHAQAKAYAELGHRVRVLIFLPVGKMCNGSYLFPPVQFIQKDRVELCYLRYFSLSNFGGAWFNTPSALMALKVNLSKVTEGFAPHVIHAHTLGLSSEAGAYLKKKLDRPLVVTTHGSDTSVPVLQGKATHLKTFAERADHIVAVSSALVRKLKTCGITVPISVILNGFRFENISKALEKRRFSIIQVGNIIAQKKVDITIRAFASLHRRYPEATLEIVGAGGELEQLLRLCRELNVEQEVHFCGAVPNTDVLDWMAKCEFFCMPSVDEGFGIVYLEAMAAGCITIGTEGEGIADVIEHGKNGFLVPADNPDAIVNVVEWCVANPKEANIIAGQGKQDAMALTWENNARQYIRLFEKLIKGNS
ncbi:glycosyltransferase family 4 protein [Lawsonibacter sp. LCP25S3_G6]|uniref:glycosyltransferase family 4 protein n=1 Tax=unclassified Lawsonibacter TaxID=2617946 RepID=UPI003F97FE1D